jgi:hypothetical protein
MAQLLDDSGILASATGITVYAPDGWAQFHSLENDPDPSLYHVYGNYPPADFYYEEEADVESPSSYGWCDYSAPSAAGRYNGDPIEVENGLQLLLAFIRDGAYLDTGKLNDQNKLDGEGPFRVVTPQKVPCPPDQSQKAENQEVVWPYDKNADHNAGFASRSATMIRVEPLPEGTTDIDILEAGWNFVDEAKIIVYGAIDPVPTIEEKLDALMTLLWAAEWSDYKNCVLKWTMTVQCAVIKKMVAKGATKGALKKIENDLLKKTDGYVTTGKVDKNDWIRDSDLQTSAYWAIHEIMILMKILQ